MSTQIKFDIVGLSRAITAGNASYQLALYADNATVDLPDSDESGSAGRVLHGKSDIASWIEEKCAKTRVHRVDVPDVLPDQVTLIEEGQTVNGSNFRYACSAEVHGGQITREVVRAQLAADAQRALPPSHFLG